MSPRSPASLSEGEVVSGDEEKAISTTANKTHDSKVNSSIRHQHTGSSSRISHFTRSLDRSSQPGRQVRDTNITLEQRRDRSRSPYRRERSRSRSPYRAGRPSSSDKRKHEDDHYSYKGGSDPRRFKVHYESGQSDRNEKARSHRSYIDPDRPEQAKGALPYDDAASKGRGLYTTPGNRKRDRDRSRSPFRHDRSTSVTAQQNGSQRDLDTRHKRYDRGGFRETSPGEDRARAQAYRQRESGPVESVGRDVDRLKFSDPRHARDEGDGDVGQRSVGHDDTSAIPTTFAKSSRSEGTIKEEEDKRDVQLSEAEVIEQRRKRREAIKARHKTNPPLLVQALEQNLASAPSTPYHDSSDFNSEQHSPPSSMGSPQTPQRGISPDSPAAFVVSDDEELIGHRDADNAADEEEGPSAADYDPNQDMEEDRPDHKRQEMLTATAENGLDEPVPQAPAPQEDIPKPSKEFDMFADDDDDDDMFAPTDATSKPQAAGITQARALDQSLLDNWDYPDGHYRIILGELLDGRYAVQQQIGKGTFATVVRALDTRTGNPVAVKIACNNETMYKAGTKEMDMLHVLNEHDPEDKRHIIRLLRNFDHKGHLCLVFENLSADLREVLKKFGRNVGLNLKAIRSYAQQMFLALSHMKKCNILHADLKPDNILVSEKRSLLKVCDLGTAAFANDAEVTPYLVSRFYRAPEVILGMPFDYAIDMWSIGCTLFELYTGRILFTGADNNQMLRAIQECRGKFPVRILKRSTLADKHFDMDGNFFSQERDRITGKATLRQMNFHKTVAGKDLRSRLSGNTKGMTPDDVREHTAFVDLMDKCLQLDPARRISPNDALRHGFIAHERVAASQHEGRSERIVRPAMNVTRVR